MARKLKPALSILRPMPPAIVTEGRRFHPAPAVLEWINDQIVSESGALHNPEHAHLAGADLECLWAPGAFAQKGRTVIGTAEEVAFRAGGWQKARQEEQFELWFGCIPKYLITLAGDFCAECTDAEFCALVEHEMYHVAQATDLFGAPAFQKDGRPKLFIRGHDVEEFVGVVRRYGAGDPGGAIARLAAAARGKPQVSTASIAGACGTCLLKVA